MLIKRTIGLHGFILALLVLLFSGCAGDSWEGVVFPKKDNRLIYSSLGPFTTLKECQDACMGKLKLLNAINDGYFDCGKNCAAGGSSFNRGCEANELGNLYK